MSIANMLVQSTAASLDPKAAPMDIAGNLARGADLALKAEQIQQEKQALLQKREQVKAEQAAQFWDRFDKISKIQGMSAKQKTLAGRGMRDALGLSDAISDDILQISATDPVMKAKIGQATSDLRNGKISYSEWAKVTTDVIAANDYAADIDEFFKEGTKAEETRIGAEAQQNALRATQNRFDTGERNKKTRDFQQDKQELSKVLRETGINSLNTGLKSLEKQIPGGIENWKGGTIPGVSGPDSLLPLNRLSPEGKRNRQTTQLIGNQYIKMITGAGVGVEEADRLLSSIGMARAIGEGGGWKAVFKGEVSPEQYVNGMRGITNELRQNEESLRGAYGDDVYAEVTQPARRVPLVGERPGKEAPSETPTIPDVVKNQIKQTLEKFPESMSIYVEKLGMTEDEIKKQLGLDKKKKGK